jgi:tRNA(Ile)-lysidine synthase
MKLNKYRKESPTGTPLEPLEKKIYQRLKGLRSQLEGQKLLVAVSGGIDSVVLLYVLRALSTRLGYSLHVAHVNHGVRGMEADSDSEFVKEISKKLGLIYTGKKLEQIKVTAGEGLLRKRRYEILFDLKKKLKAAFIVVAHHRDDLLETRLMRLLQGTGIHGLKAMVVQSEEGVLRPFLEIARAEIEQYARSKKLRWRNDATNEDTTKLRNWIRRNWLRTLRLEHPEYVDNLFESLHRIIESNDGRGGLGASSNLSVFNRKSLTTDEIYTYLRHHAQSRVTSRHVSEFKKRLSSPQRRFTFRLAGVDWLVNQDSVAPR